MVSVWTAVLLVALLVLYYIVTITNANVTSGHLEMIREHPYPVIIEAGKVETDVVRMMGEAERLLYIHTPEAVKKVEENINGRLPDMEAAVEQVSNGPAVRKQIEGLTLSGKGKPGRADCAGLRPVKNNGGYRRLPKRVHHAAAGGDALSDGGHHSESLRHI